MHGPDGISRQMVKQFLDVLPNERIVLRHQEPPAHAFTMTMTFEERAGGTLLTWRMRFDSASELARMRAVIETANDENFDRLAAFLARA